MNKKETLIDNTHLFKVHVPNLLNEIADCGLRKNQGVLKIPLNLLRKYLLSVATRAAEINDPILNKLMCEMALYDVADPSSQGYNEDVLFEVYDRANKYLKTPKDK